MCHSMMGLTGCYKTAVFLHFIFTNERHGPCTAGVATARRDAARSQITLGILVIILLIKTTHAVVVYV